MIQPLRCGKIGPRQFWMIHFRREPLLPAHVSGLGESAANVAGDNLRSVPQLRQRPDKIGNCEAAVLPICCCFGGPKTIKVDCNVNISTAKVLGKALEMFAPIVAQNCTATLSIS